MRYRTILILLFLLVICTSGVSAGLTYQQDRKDIEHLADLYFETNQISFLDSAVQKLEKMKVNIILDLLSGANVHEQSDEAGSRNPLAAFHEILQHRPKVKDVQRDFIRPKQTVLDFMVTQDRFYTFIITRDTLDVVVQQIGREDLAKDVFNFVNSLFSAANPLELRFDINLAHKLYQQLIFPVEDKISGAQSLIIIPDDALLGLPFEALVPDSAELASPGGILYEEFEKVNFMVHRYATAYNYSLSTMDPQFHVVHRQKELGRRLLTMSRIIPSPEVADRYNCSDAPHGQEEASRVSMLLWRHNNLSHTSATKRYFLKNSSYYRWIYFANPVILRNDSPDSSVIVFSQPQDASGDGLMFITDLDNCDIKADLMTLSGCRLFPNSGEINTGFIAMPQTLLLAGARSLMINLWHINDITVSRFMAKYYWELKYKRQTNSIALREAKVTSMKGSYKYHGREISRAHPYFWAPFILIGNANIRPPTFSTIPPQFVVLIVYIIVGAYALFMIRRTRGS